MPYAVVQVAATPGTSTGLSTAKLGAIGIVAGLLVGCGIALVREQFDDRIRVSPDLDSAIDGPVLGELPEDADVRKGKVALVLVEAPQSALAEAVRDLRTSLRVLLVDEQCPVITVTSPEPGDGKTFVTANLAASWALTGSRVIVVSADFRRPRLEEALGIDRPGAHGLSDLIKANWKLAEPEGGGRGPDAPGGGRCAGGEPAPTRGHRGRRPPGGDRRRRPATPAGGHRSRQSERALRQPRDPARPRPPAPPGRRRPPRHPPGPGRPRHRHPRRPDPRGTRGGVGGQDRPCRPRPGRQPAAGHRLPGARSRPQPRAARHRGQLPAYAYRR